MLARYVMPAALILALAACGGQKEQSGPERKTAAGEVLGGSISDEMLPLDTVTSQSPPLSESASEADEVGTDETEDDEAPAKARRPAAKPSPSASTSAPAASPSASTSPAAEN